jgi:hypothetical protein
VAGLSLCAVLAATLAACGGDGGDAMGETACTSIEASLRALHQSTLGTNTTERAALAQTAAKDLRAALRPAELAGQQSSDWQALAATVEEIQQNIPEQRLASALRAQCAATPAAK